MARLWPGNSDNERVALAAAGDRTNLFSYTVSIWAYRVGSDLGRVWTKGVFAPPEEYHLENNASLIRFRCERWSGTDGLWTWNNPLTLNTWVHVCITYSGSSTANDPILYYDGVDQGASDSQSGPSGNFSNASSLSSHIIGNSGAENKSFDGRLCEFALWNRVLEPGEVATLAAGKSPLRVRRDPDRLRVYLPIYGNLGNPSTERGYTRSSPNGASVRASDSLPQADHAPVGPPYGFD